MRLAFLCGAGLSIPVGMPSTREITEKILSGDGVARHTNSNYYFGNPRYSHMGIGDEYVPKVCGYLAILKNECDGFYQFDGNEEEQREKWKLFGKHETNYEDLYYVASQIRDSEIGEYENPVIKPFIDKIENSDEFRQVLNMTIKSCFNSIDYSEIIREACNYIECVVYCILGREPKNFKALGLFEDLLKDDSIEKLDIFTLNHDLVFESFCATMEISLTDGFGMANNKVKYWNPALLDDENKRIRLLKLHGSINWIQYPSNGEDLSSRFVGIPLEGDLWHTKNQEGKFQHPTTSRPKMLIGTFNKLMHYTTGIFADLHYLFYRDLPLADVIIVCGYGFGDKGINTRLLDWVFSSPKRKIVVIDPGLEELQWTARGAIRRNWKDLQKSGKIHFIQKGIEKVEWRDLKAILS